MAAGQEKRGLAPVERVVIVGAGIAGLACALACTHAGASVEVVEARDSIGPTPAHLDIVPNLLRELARLGVAEECVRRGFAYNGLAVVDEEGNPGFEIPTPRLGPGHLPCAAGIAYDELLDILKTNARTAGAVVRTGLRAESVDAEAGAVVLGSGGVLRGDLVILATGASAALARPVFGERWRSASAHSWWHALLPRPRGLERTTWMAGAPGHRLLLVPVDMSRAGVAVVRTGSADLGTDGSALRAMLAGWGGLPRRLAALMQPDTPTTMRPSGMAFLDPPWHHGAVLCVGACANALPPPFGQAAAQAVEDAVVLGDLVAAKLDRGSLLARYMERRRERARRVHVLLERASRWITQPEPSTDLVALMRELGSILAVPA